MRDLSQEKVWSFRADGTDGGWGKCQFRKNKGVLVQDYRDLVQKVAAVQFNNPNFLLLYRGQGQDYRIDNSKKQNSTIRPSIFRRDGGYGVNRWNAEVRERYDILTRAEQQLVRRWRSEFGGQRKLERSAAIRWSILQHYEVCDTPLLDVTHSLRVAASFASLNNNSDEAFVMALAVPQINGAVSACAYHEMQVLRLSSLCPPSAMRPHLQEGYVVGEYPELRTVGEKMNLRLHETDFGQRLIAKFRFNPNTFWDDEGDFPRFSREALSMNDSQKSDVLIQVTSEIKNDIGQTQK